ncbi:MAG: tetratricopeptide repeat protein [Bacteroidia bacterium]|nr:tetratricopeptide repeat protein [Bacteroidia bacterium]
MIKGKPHNTLIFSNVFLIVIMLFTLTVNAQFQSSAERTLVREGNDLYKTQKYNDAEIKYRKGLEKNNASASSNFNLGDALYKQGKFTEASSQFDLASKAKSDKATQAQAYHNLGNSLLKEDKYQESVDAYKKSLINNPADDQTRYNLAYAMSKLKQQQQQQQQQKDKNKDQKDKKQDQKNNQSDKKDKPDDKKNQEQPQDNKADQDKQQAQQSKPKISKEDAERMLAALKTDEKDLQKRMQKKQAGRRSISKNW